MWIFLLIILIIIFSCYGLMRKDFFFLQKFIDGINSVMENYDDIFYNSNTGLYTIVTKKKVFKILQLTDIHLGGSLFSYFKDKKALMACYQLIISSEPDLIIVTGDLIYPVGVMSFSFNNRAPVIQFCNFMKNIGVPWAFTYGNHDTEEVAVLDIEEFNSLLIDLSKENPKKFLYPSIQPDIYGRNNQVIEIRNEYGNLIQALFLMDSNSYINGKSIIRKYDYIRDDQVEWYRNKVLSLSEQEGGRIDSMIFFHIPLYEYRIINNLYKHNSSDIVYYYGKISEKICTSAFESKLFNTAIELGSTKAMFWGHDHYNNQSLEYKGIRMTYGYSIDYLAMPGICKHNVQRGGTLISINCNGGFKVSPCRLVDI